MTHSFEAYIDESGCEGFKFRPQPQPGSPEWFVLSAVIIPRSKIQNALKVADDIRSSISAQKKFLHWADLNHEQRIAWIDVIAKSDTMSTSILVNKPKLDNQLIFQQKDRLYFYTTRLLLERISWFCRDCRYLEAGGDGTAKLIFSKRKSMAYDALLEYLQTLRRQAIDDVWLEYLTYDIRIHWPAIKTDHISVLPHKARVGLQMADAVCGGLRAAVEYTRYNFTEHRYAKILKPNIYWRPKSRFPGTGKNYLSYGLKFFPATPAEDEGRPPRYHWIGKYYS